MIGSPSPESFQRQLEHYHRSRGGKFVHAPLQMLSSAIRRGYCRAMKKVLPTRVKTFWGRPMQVMLPEPGSVALMHYGFLEEGLTSLVLKVLRPGMIFYDVGAHYGYFTLLASELVGPAGQVHSFEPSPHTFDVLRKNTADAPNVRLNNMALFSERGELTFKDFGIEFSEFNTFGTGRIDENTRRKRNLQPKEIKVRADMLDHYVQETGATPDFIKIDAEGAEKQIFGGMTELLRDARPMITIEVAPDLPEAPGDSAGNVRFLQEFGYVPHEWSDGQLRTHQPRDSYTYDNLLFIHPEGRRIQ